MNKSGMRACVALIAILWLVSCQSAPPRTADQVVDDRIITSTVKARLYEDRSLRDIEVTTYKGQVTLTGVVDNPLQRRDAESIARGVEGVTGVNNQIQVKRVRSPMRW